MNGTWSQGEYRVPQGAELVQNTAQGPHITGKHISKSHSFSLAPNIRHALAVKKVQTGLTHR